MAAKKATVLVAGETFTAQVGGETVVVHAGQRVVSSHPLVKGREALFAEPGPDVEPGASAR